MVHCFAIYSSSWEFEFGENTLPYVPAYSWVNPFMAIFALQGFFFISGYLSSMKRKEEVPHEYLHFVKKKFSRLYFPSIIFSLLYLYFFTGHPTWGDVGYAAFSGKGHLWFLPTLFWVAVIYESVACWASRHKYIVLIGFFILAYLGFLIGVLFSDLPINLFVRVTKYLFFYALGACLWQERTERTSGSDIDREPLWHVVGIFASGLLLWLTSYTSLWGLLGNGIISKTYTAGLDPLIALLMIIGMYKSWMMLDVRTPDLEVSSVISRFSRDSFAIYILHQFVLYELIFRSPELLKGFSIGGGYLVPFLFIVIAIVASSLIIRGFRIVI